MRRCRWGTLDCVSGDALAPGPLASARLPAVFRKLSGGSGIAGLGKGAQRQTPHPRFICCPGAVSPAPLSALSQRLPSALQVLCVFMKVRAQLHRWPPLVLLQSCEQVPQELMHCGHRAKVPVMALPLITCETLGSSFHLSKPQLLFYKIRNLHMVVT